MNQQAVAIISGGPIEGFTGGWAKFPFSGQRTHYWVDRDADYRAVMDVRSDMNIYESLCDVAGYTTERAPALHEGNWPRCKHCNKYRRMVNASVVTNIDGMFP